MTLFESQIILAEHECCTTWGDCTSNKSNQIKSWFLRRGENRSSRRKTSRSRVENQQTQPTYDAGSGNRTRDTLLEGERSHHCAIPAPLRKQTTYQPCNRLIKHTLPPPPPPAALKAWWRCSRVLAPPPTLSSLPFCADFQFSRDSLHAFNDLREYRGLCRTV